MRKIDRPRGRERLKAWCPRCVHVAPLSAGLIRRLVAAGSIALTAILGSMAAVRAGDELTNAQVLANLTEIVFGSEFVGEDSALVRKWHGPMRVAIYSDDESKYRHLIDPHLARLSRLTGIDISVVPQWSSSENAHILLLGWSQFHAYAESHLGIGKNPQTNTNLACYGFFTVSANDVIDEVFAVIPSAISRPEIESCVIEEMSQLLGLPNDSFDVAPSIFNDNEEYHDLTWQDELFLRVLYDPRVRSGMTRAEFERLARGIIDELRPGH